VGVVVLVTATFLLLSSSRFDYALHNFKEKRLNDSLRNTPAYSRTYEKELQELRKGSFRQDQDSLQHAFEEYGGDLIDIILFKDLEYEIFDGCHICGSSAQALAISDANHAYRQEKFGKGYYEKAIKKKGHLEHKYRLNELDSVLLSASELAFRKTVINGREVAQFDKTHLKGYPLKFEVKASPEEFAFKENNKAIYFTAAKHGNDTAIAQLPLLYLKVYIDKAETDYPYTDIPIKILRLNDWNFNNLKKN
jgi:hypothetical protein